MDTIPPEIRRLATLPVRISGTDAEIEAAFWAAYPRYRFFKTLPYAARLLDIGAGSGGLALWREWGHPNRHDLRLHGIDFTHGEHAHRYEQWHACNLDDGMPDFGTTRFDAFMLSHLIEHVASPATLLRNLAAVANAGALIYLEWPHPRSKDMPSARLLQSELGFVMQTLNFFDDATHRETPERSAIEPMLQVLGFRILESSEPRLGALAEEMIARGRRRDDLTFRQMGLWAALGWSNVVIACYEPG